MTPDEELVRSKWEKVSIGQPTNTDYDGEWKLTIASHLTAFVETTPTKCWAKAAKFTRVHEKEMEDLRADINWVESRVEKIDTIPERMRIFNRLKAALEQLLKGRREGA